MLKITVSWLESFRFSVTLSAPKTLVIIMNYAIEFHDANYPFLNVAARKKSLKHSLLSVVSGLAIIKLGKQSISGSQDAKLAFRESFVWCLRCAKQEK